MKRISSSAAIEETLALRKTNQPPAVAFFYFDFSDHEKQKYDNLLRSLIVQLSSQCPEAMPILKALYSKYSSGTWKATASNLETALSEIISVSGRVYIVIDALDECIEQDELLLWLADLQLENLHILVTSRREKDIEDYLGPVTTWKINLQSALVDQDIGLYISSLVEKDPKLRKWEGKFETKLEEGAKGM